MVSPPLGDLGDDDRGGHSAAGPDIGYFTDGRFDPARPELLRPSCVLENRRLQSSEGKYLQDDAPIDDSPSGHSEINSVIHHQV